jgi:hypothetical protein
MGLRLHRPYVPLAHVKKPQRAVVRQQMHGRLVGMNDNRRDRSAGWFILLALVIAFYFGAQLVRGVF